MYIRDQDAESSSGKPQFLHAIDRVLQPVELKQRLSSSASAAFVGLTAGKLLREQDKFDLGKYSIR